MKKQILNLDWVFLARATLLVAFFCFLFVFLNTTDDFYNMTVMIIFTLTLTAAVAYWLWKGQKRAVLLGWQIGLYFLVFLITALVSIDPRRSLGELVFLFIAIFLFAFFVKLREWGWGADLILGAMLVAGSVMALILWMQVAQWYLQWLDIAPGQWIPTITYRLPIPNVLAIFFNPLLMIVICKFFTASRWGWRFLYLLYGLAVAGLSFLASSRAAWLGAAVGLAFILFWVIRENRHRWLSFWKFLFQRKVVLVLLALVVLVVVGAGGYLLYQQTIHPTHGSLANARIEYWPPAWETFLKDPLTGQGPYTFISTWVQTYSVPPWGLFPHAHSTLFNLLAEEGILGLGAFLLLLASAFLLLWRRLKEREKEGQPAALAGMGALTALTVQGFFDCYHVETLGLWTVLILLGIGVGKRIEIEGKKRRPWWLIILPLALVWNLWTLDPLVRGIEAANGEDWQGAADQLTESVLRDPFQAIPHQQLGLVYANLAEAGNPAALPQAIAQFERTVELDPGWELNWLNLGVVYLSADQNELALAALQKARALAPSSAVVMLNLGMAAEINGDETTAKQAFAQLLELKPDWIKAGFWRESELRMEVATSWKDEHPAGTEPSIETLEASVAANRAVALPYIRLAKAYLAAGRVEEAETNLQMAAIAYFWSEEERLEVYWWLAVIAHDRGDVEMAVQLAEPVFWGYQAQGIYGAGMYGNYIYAQIGFRRPAMGIDYVPQVRQTIYTDEWGWRMFTLSQWFEELGDYDRAGEIQIRVLELIPDILQSRD